MSNAFICLLGIGTVFAGLICLIILVYITSAICKALGGKKSEAPVNAQTAAAGIPTGGAPIANKQEIVAGVCAVIAEELGTDVKNIKVVSFKRA